MTWKVSLKKCWAKCESSEYWMMRDVMWFENLPTENNKVTCLTLSTMKIHCLQTRTMKAQLVQWLGYGMDELGFAWQGICLLSKMLRQTAGPTQPPVRYWEVRWPGCEFDHLVQRLRMSGVIPLLYLYVLVAWRGRTLPLLLALCLM
jgi:hypothetical protein